MRIATAITTGVIVLSGVCPAVAAQPPETSADVVGNIRVTSPTTATVRARYTCSPVDPAVALWVAVKQGTGLAEPDRTSSRFAAAYSQSHAEVGLLLCDGKNHVASFTVNQAEGQGFGTLTKGARSYVQFCLTPASARSEADVISSMEFAQAV